MPAARQAARGLGLAPPGQGGRIRYVTGADRRGSQITLAADAAPRSQLTPWENDMQESRTAFVTGGGSGIGLAIVRCPSRRGMACGRR